MEELKKLLEEMLVKSEVDLVDGWNEIDGLECTYGVSLRDGRDFFITIEEA